MFERLSWRVAKATKQSFEIAMQCLRNARNDRQKVRQIGVFKYIHIRGE